MAAGGCSFRANLCAWFLSVAVFVAEHRGQEYALAHGDPVMFWVPDAQPPKYGTCCYLWGYWPCIVCDGKTVRFEDVEWCYGWH